jgi:hypothetical protein
LDKTLVVGVGVLVVWRLRLLRLLVTAAASAYCSAAAVRSLGISSRAVERRRHMRIIIISIIIIIPGACEKTKERQRRGPR